MDQSLRNAVEQGSIDALYALIREDVNVLDRIDDIPFVETPLHLAASLGYIQFAMEIMKLKPSFARKLNEDGFTPMHLALQKHYADEEGNTLLHVAVYRNQLEVVSLLMATKLVDLKAKNLEGDTVFDILERQTHVESQRMRDRLRPRACCRCVSRLIAIVKLSLTPFQNFVQRLCGKLFVRIRRQETVTTEERRNALLVVAALLLTVTYQAALSAPAEAHDKANQFNGTAPINASRDPLAHLFNSTAPLRAYWNAITAASNAINKNVLNGNAFLSVNTLTYFLTTVTLLFLVPPDFVGLVLYSLLVLLSFCYCFSRMDQSLVVRLLTAACPRPPKRGGTLTSIPGFGGIIPANSWPSRSIYSKIGQFICLSVRMAEYVSTCRHRYGRLCVIISR
ncbi:ankyrin repeat-containing protein NPR4-like [Corylus avellana]|uniref:ankyrin repeat-containing protein NPR4-like n=1 Tax=Corylus avellana TaxID=13451 RepID=UPI00286BF92D|nr:ankyrin repeat-containing protein NPR4-like [Corylus avellana]